jgi:hypothetical protein
MNMKLLTFALAGIIVGIGTQSSLSRIDENGFLNRFGGAWSGSATIVKDNRPWQVNCHIDGQPGHHSIEMQGNCSASLLRRSYAANLVYDPATGLYTGTYVGAKVGPAQLSGTRKGDLIDLTITWPKPVNGNTKAKLLIENSGGGTLRITLDDDDARTDFLLQQI